MSKYRTAMGKSLDMGILRAKNQNVRAVGNMNVDAAGNTLDSNNEVISDSTKRVNQVYGKTTVNPGASPRGRALPPDARGASVSQQHLSPLQRKLQAESEQSVEPPMVTPQNVQPSSTPTSHNTPLKPAARVTPKPDDHVINATSSTITESMTEDTPSQAELESMQDWDDEIPEGKTESKLEVPAISKTRKR